MNNSHFGKIILSLVISFTLASFSGCGGKKGETLVKVGGEKITEGDLDLLIRVNPRLKARLAAPSGKQKLVENYVEQELFYQESKKRGLHRSAAVRDKIDLYDKILIAQAILDDELDKKVKEYYENHRDEFERTKISHILIRTSAGSETPKPSGKDKTKKEPKVKFHTEAEAMKLIEEISAKAKQGEDFGKLA